MLTRHIMDALSSSDLSKEQEQQFIDLLLSIKDNPLLLSEFSATDVDILRGNIHSAGSDNDTFLNLDISIDEGDSLITDQNTYEGLEFNIIEEIVDLSTDTYGPSILDSDEDALDDSPTGAFPIPRNRRTAKKLGRYIDLGILGQGGMGEVRKVHDEELKRNLAMKIIHSSMLSSRNALSRFTEEAQVGAQLQHPNIIPIHEFGELPDGRLYFTMTQIKGREFTDFIRNVHEASDEDSWNISNDGTTFRQLIQIFHKICETMAYAHSVGVVHRDLKPENVMIGSFGEVLVVDWGIAKVYGSEETIDLDEEDMLHTGRSEQNHMNTRMGIIAGTPSYMSPEQAEGRIDLLGPSSDIYTLGAILYEILSGRPPYNGTSALEIVEKVKSTPPPSLLTTNSTATILNFQDAEPLDEHQGKAPLPLIEMCQRAMQREIENRYLTASEFANEIFNWLEGAQKRDKALNEYNTAMELLEQAEQLEQEYEVKWNTANELIQSHGFTSSKNWIQWEQANQTILQAQALRQEYRSAIQGVLIYDSELEEANEAMSELLIKDIVQAVAFGEPRQRESLERELTKHLQHLPKHTQQRFLDQVEKERKDDILLIRARRGTMVGRKKMRTQIIHTLQGSSRLVSLIGTAGVGKSRLALEVIHELQTTEDHTYFCDLTQANSEIGVALFVAKSMNIKLRNIDPIGQLGELFAQQKTILVLDNLEQVLDGAGKVLRRWMTQADTLRIIATSRMKLRIESELSFSVQPLSILESMELFTKRGQQVKASFALQESTRETIGRLVNQLDHLPLAIELAAARLNIFNVDEIELRLKERFDLLRSRSSGTQPLHAALDWSWDLLKPWAKAALSQTSVFRGGFEINAAEQILDSGSWKDAPPVFDLLQDLCDDSLLIENRNADGEIRFGLLESIRQYANEQLLDQDSVGHDLSGPVARIETQQRHAIYYSQFGNKSFLDMLDNSEIKNQWNHFFEELENFIIGIEYGRGNYASNCCMAALKILSMKGPVSLGVDLAGSVLVRRDTSDRAKRQLQTAQRRFLRISGRMEEARSTGGQNQEQRMVSINPLPNDEDEKTESLRSQTNKDSHTQPDSKEHHRDFSQQQQQQQPIESIQLEADDLLEQGNLEEAESSFDEALVYYRKASGLYQQIDNQSGLVESLQKMANVFRNQGLNNEALEHLNKALEISKLQGFNSIKATIYSDLGTVYNAQSLYDKALEVFQKALDVNDLLNDQFLKSSILGRVGTVYINLGQMKNALAFSNEGLEIAQDIGDIRSEGRHLGALGRIYQDFGQNEKAIQCIQQAIEITRTIGNRRAEEVNLGRLGYAYSESGQYEEAFKSHQAALQISKEIGTKGSEGVHLGNLGLIYCMLGQPEDGLRCQKAALRIARERGNKGSEGVLLGNLGDTLFRLGRVEESKTCLLQAIPICEELFPLAAGAYQGSLALILATQGDLESAMTSLYKGESLIEPFPSEHGKFLCKKATVHHIANQYKEAHKAFEQARTIASELSVTDNSELGLAIGKISVLLSVEPAPLKQSLSKNSETETVNTVDKEYLKILADELIEQGNLEEAESKYQQALELYYQALDCYKRSDHAKGIIEVHLKIGKIHQHQADFDSAQQRYQRALQLSKEQNFLLLHTDALNELGEIQGATGNYHSALEYFMESLKGAQYLQDLFREETILGNIGMVYRNLGEYTEAIVYLEQAIELAKTIGNKRNKGINFASLGTIYLEMGQIEKAISHHETSIQIAKEVGDKRVEGSQYGNLANIYKSLGKLDEAVSQYRMCLQISIEIGNKRIQGINLGNLGDLYCQMEQWRAAEEHLQNAVEMCKTIVPNAAGAFLGSLAWVYAQQSKMTEALQTLSDGEPLVNNHPFEYGKFLCKKSNILRMANHLQESALAFEQAKRIAKELQTDVESELSTAIAETERFLSSSELNSSNLLQDPSSISQRLNEDTIEDIRIEADALLEQGNLEEAESLYEKALDVYTQALAMYTKIGSSKGMVETNFKIVQVYRKQGQYDKASALCMTSLQIAEKNRLVSLKVDCLSEMGVIESLRGNNTSAMEYYQQASHFAQKIGNKFQEKTNYISLGLLYQDVGDSHKAIQVFTEAINIAKELGDKLGESITYGNLGNVYKATGDYPEAMKQYTMALDIAKEIGNKRTACANLGNIANLHQDLGNTTHAIEFYQQARNLSVEIGDKQTESVQLGNLGVAYSNLEKYDEAVYCYKKSIQLTRETGNKLNEGIQHGNLGDLLIKIEQLEEAEQYLKEAVEICTPIFAPAAGAFMGSLAWVYSQQSKMDDAQHLLERAEGMVQRIPLEYGKFLCKKSKILHLLNQPKGAQSALDKAKLIAKELNASPDSELCKAAVLTTTFLSTRIPPSNSTHNIHLTEDQIEDLELDADDLLEQGNIEEAESFYEKAMSLYTNALNIYTQIDKVSGMIKTNLMIGNVYTAQGEYLVAKVRYERCLELSKEHHLFLLHADSLNQLAGIQRILEEYPSALENYQEALKIVRVSEDSFREGSILGSLGLLYESLTEYSNAIDCFQKAIRITQQIGDKRTEGIHLGNLGTIYKKIGQYEKGAAIYIQAEEIAREINDKRSLGIHLGNLGNLYYFLEKYEDAIKYLEQGVEIAHELGNKRSEAIHLGNLGIVLGDVQKWKEAHTHLTASINLCKNVFPTAGGAFSAYLAVILAHQQNFEEAIKHIEYGESIVKDSPLLLSHFLCNKAKVLHLSNQTTLASESLTQAQRIAKEIQTGQHSELSQIILKTEQFISMSSNPNETYIE